MPPAEQDTSQPTQAASPLMRVAGQYIKDLSFENPGPPSRLPPRDKRPNIEVKLNVQTAPGAEGLHEVSLKIDIVATDNETAVFAVQLLYGGLFEIGEVPEPLRHQILYAEAPRYLFPFARQIVSNIVQASGLPPLLLDPVDFTANYREAIKRSQEGAEKGGAEPPAADS